MLTLKMIENYHGQFRGGVRYGSTFEYGKLVFQWPKRENLTYIRWKGMYMKMTPGTPAHPNCAVTWWFYQSAPICHRSCVNSGSTSMRVLGRRRVGVGSTSGRRRIGIKSASVCVSIIIFRSIDLLVEDDVEFFLVRGTVVFEQWKPVQTEQ